MNIGKRIYQLRKSNNITQEQLANAMGVSPPAVSKWETGVTMPDITLLAPIARMLHTTIDDLLSYKQELTEKEADSLLGTIKEECKKSGFRKGMRLAMELLKEYPNSDYLKLKISMDTVMLAFTVDEDYSEEEFQELVSGSTKYLEELLNSEDINISAAATACLVSRYMQDGRLKEAEVLLDKYPKQNFNPNQMRPTLYLLQTEFEKALQAAEQNILLNFQNVLMEIRTLHTIMLRKEDYDMALQYAQGYATLAETFGNPLGCPSEILVDTYLAMNDMKHAELYFQKYTDEIINISSDYSKSIYLKNIADKIVVTSNTIEEDIRLSHYKALLMNPRYEEIRKTDVGRMCLTKMDENLHIQN